MYRTFYDCGGICNLLHNCLLVRAEKDLKTKLVRRASSVLDCLLDLIKDVAERRMLEKLTSIMNKFSHPLHKTVGALNSSQQTATPIM